MSAPTPASALGQIEYPESDGKPMADSDAARDLMMDLIDTLRHHFAAREDVYVSGDILLYYEEGNPRKSVAPDVLVTFGIPKGQRGVYKLWEEGKAPDFVLEIVSKTTWQVDHAYKPVLYHSLGIREYFLFDHSGDWLPEGPLVGFRLNGLEYVPIEANERGRLPAETLDLELVTEDGEVRLVQPGPGLKLLTSRERAREEHRRREEAERRWEEAEHQRQEAEHRAQAAEATAEEEVERRAVLERELERLRREVAKLRPEERPSTDPG